ncbi:putative UDP-N-acetylmuramoyl-tripeptide--D-alanyl-D-alanine ligase [alpha proteobacterium Q-1]|nr:putative UDP-N-acetylmuramoyl-tripeptide--D-alanyl-D-alanine ligase [alpha proteobacterium Q-1]
MSISFILQALLVFLWTLAIVFFVLHRGRAYLMYFQQEEYDGSRFRHWLKDRHGRDRLTSLAAILAGGLSFGAAYGLSWLDTPALMILIAGLYEGFRRSRKALLTAKKPLVSTERARRILAVYLALMAFLGSGFLIIAHWQPVPLIAMLVLFSLIAAQIAPYALLAANRLLSPFEQRVKARYLGEAKEKLAHLQPYIIAITGSYGKTSTKSILAHILSSAAPTLATPGSINTDMGITRVVREQLKPDHRYFIVEMGAYGPGSIARLCRLAPPKLAIITAVGWAHYERFKTVDRVFDAKFEMADAARANGGKTIVNRDAVPQNKLDERLSRDDSLILVKTNPHAEAVHETITGLSVQSAKQDRDGISLVINGSDFGEISLRAPLYGLHQGQNIACATAAALQMGMPISSIKAALATVPQSRHRLEVIEAKGITIIDDAYNSNPSGFASGLELLDILQKPGGRRLLITPGMVELGSRHDEEHRTLGELAGQHVDIALIVTPERILSFIEGFNSRKNDQAQLLRFATQDEAQNWIKDHARADDVILYENNLPDLYEQLPGF